MGRRWLQFYYKGEDIAPYVPQILFYLESDPRFDSIDEALAFAKAEPPHQRPHSPPRPRRSSNRIAAGTNLVVVSTIDVAGRPASRLMRFVKTEPARGLVRLDCTRESQGAASSNRERSR